MYDNPFVDGIIFTVVTEFSLLFLYVLFIAIWRIIRKIIFKGEDK